MPGRFVGRQKKFQVAHTKGTVLYWALAFHMIRSAFMSVVPLIRAVEEEHLRTDVPQIASGDTVRVHVKVVEGSRERIQVFEGIIIRHHGEGLNRSFTVRRIAHGVGVERSFLMNSPRIDKIEVVRHAVVRRKNLYYMRGLRGKAARLKERRV
jgi:large subunit ribosomal protein L19